MSTEQLSIDALAALVRAGALPVERLTAELQQRIDAFEKGELREEGEYEHEEANDS